MFMVRGIVAGIKFTGRVVWSMGCGVEAGVKGFVVAWEEFGKPTLVPAPKSPSPAPTPIQPWPPEFSEVEQEAISGLRGLGCSAQKAMAAVVAARESHDGTVQGVIRLALAYLNNLKRRA